MKWPYPFSATERIETKAAFEQELRRELKPGHPLFGLPVAAIAYDQDDVLFMAIEGSGRFAQVHLTWAGEKEKPPWPGTTLFDSFDEWVQSVKDEYGDSALIPDP